MPIILLDYYYKYIIYSIYTFAHLKRRGSKNLVITCRGTGMKFYKA